MFSFYSNSQAESAPSTGRDTSAPAQFFAGWFDIIVQEDERNYILDCYTENTELTDVLYDAMEAYIAGDKSEGDAKMSDTKPLFKTAFADCGELKDQMDAWSKKFDDLTKRDDWAIISQLIYEENKDVIDRDMDLELREWKQGVYFNSGMFAGQLIKVFLDNYQGKSNDAEQPEAYMYLLPF